MNILILGASGFIGSNLCTLLQKNPDHKLIAISRNKEQTYQILKENIEIIEANPLEKGEWLKTIDRCDAIINLAGESLTHKRWTEKQKNMIYLSRIMPTKHIVEYINTAKHKPQTLINASAIGYYGQNNHLTSSPILDEYFPSQSNSYISNLVKDWELQIHKLTTQTTRTVILRFGIVLGPNGGILQNILPIFKKGLGGTLADGTHWMSWIHIDDVISIINNALYETKYKGTFNLVSPNPVTNTEFTNVLSKILGKPAFITVPKIVLKLLYGEEFTEEIALSNIKAYPQRLIDIGYNFKFLHITDALKDIIEKI